MDRSKLQVRKIKAHCTVDDIVQGKIKLNQYMGNDWADYLAGKLTENCQVSEQTANLVGWVDATCWLIRTRIIAICRATSKPPRGNRFGIELTRRKPPTICGLLEKEGHELVQEGNRYQCALCLRDLGDRH